MKKTCCLAAALLLLAVWLCPAPALAEAAPPPVSCETYVIMDADTGQVLLEQNADRRLYPASITKIMTLALALQKADGALDFTLTVPDEAVYSLVGTESSHIALQPGEEVGFEDILYATQLASANDGANLLACYIGGDIQGGVKAMNAQAEALGLSNTHFANPHGLMDSEHYTTARDMAALTRWALGQPGFETVFCRTDTWVMGPTNLQPESRQFGSSDWMKVGDKKYREYAKGSKSGYHSQAGQTLVTLCEQDGMRLIGVLLNDVSKEAKFADACALMDYCFASFQRVEVPADGRVFEVPVLGGGGQLGEVTVNSRAASVILHKDNLDTDLTVEYELPEQWVMGTDFTAWQRVQVAGGGRQSDSTAVFALGCEGLAPVLDAAQGARLPEAPRQAHSWGAWVALGLAALALLGGGLLWRRRKRVGRPSAPVRGDWQIIHREWLPGPVIKLKRPPGQKPRSLTGRPVNPRR